MSKVKDKRIQLTKDKHLIELTFNTLLKDYTAPDSYKELTDEVIEEMLNFTPIVKAVNSLIRGILARDLIVKSEEDTEDNKIILEIQKRINGIKNKTSFIESLVKSCFTGRTLNEIVYNEDFTIKEFVNIPYSLIKYNKDIKEYELKTKSETIVLNDSRKWLLSIYNKEIGYNLGKSLLESLLDDYNNIKSLEAKLKYLCEKYGETLLIFAYGIESSDEEVEQTARELREAQGRNVIAIPINEGNLRDSIFSLRLTDMDTVIHERLIAKYEKNIVTTLLGGSLTIENEGNSGSYALGEIQQEEKEKIEDSISLYIRDELDKILEIDGLFFGYDYTKYYISMERFEKEEERLGVEKQKIEILNLKITGIEALARAGYELTEEYLAEYLGVPSVIKKEETL